MQGPAEYMDFCLHYWVQALLHFFLRRDASPVIGWQAFKRSSMYDGVDPRAFAIWLVQEGALHIKCCIPIWVRQNYHTVANAGEEIHDYEAFKEFLQRYDPISNLVLNDKFIDEIVDRLERYMLTDRFDSGLIALRCEYLANNVLPRNSYCERCVGFRSCGRLQ